MSERRVHSLRRRRPSRRRKLARLGGRLLGSLVLVAMLLLTANCASFGQTARGDRLARMQSSPQYTGGKFVNPQPLWNNMSVAKAASSLVHGSSHSKPEDPERDIPVVRGDGSRFAVPPTSGLRVTWFGHSTVLIEIDGKRVLTDPVWGSEIGPVSLVAPGRWYEPPIALQDMPRVDAVVISHDHWDHLDYATFQAIKHWDTTFVVPLGVGAHLEHWGVPASRIVELDWWERTTVNGLQLTCTPARHASGRGLLDQNATLWAGWALLGTHHRVFFSGDTGLFDGLQEIGEKLGPFDLTMVEVGAYNQDWPDWHMGPEQAVLAHQWLRGRLFLPIHWGLFDLAFHGWTEPAERVWVAAARAGIDVAIPRPGQSFEPATPPPLERWWPEVPWQTAEDHPVVATAANGRPAHERGPKRDWSDPLVW